MNDVLRVSMLQVAYRTGGTINFKWNLTVPTVSNENATAMIESLTRQGYATKLATVEYWQTNGAPSTYN